MSAPTDPAPGEERRGGRHTAPRTPLLHRPAVVAGAGAVVVLGLVVAGAAALGRPADEALAGASSSTSAGTSPSTSTSGAVPTGAPSSGAGGGATELSAPLPTGGSGSAGTTATGAPRPTATAASTEALRELAANPRVELSAQARQALLTRPVDLRLATLLVQLASQQRLSVAEVPAAASGAGDEPLRGVVLDRLEGQPVGTAPEAVALVERQLAAQDPAYRAEASLQQGQDGAAQLLVVLPPVTG